MPSRNHPAATRLLAATLLLAISVPSMAQSAEPPLNFVLLLADDLGWSDLGCYEADLHETPRLDALAEESVRFTNAYAAASICTPTRASILTGKCPAQLHMTVWREAAKKQPEHRPLLPPLTESDLPHTEVTLAEILHDAGYLTAHVGKWHLGDAAHYPQTHGFDLNIGGTMWGAPTTFFAPYSGSGTFGDEFRYVSGLDFPADDEYLTDRLTDEAIDVLRQSKDRPFFLNLWWHTVHTPIEAREADTARFQAKLQPGMNHQNPTFAAMCASLDENVGRVLDELDRLGVADRTVVIFASDNGGFINKYQGETVTNNSPLRSGKGSLYEGGTRIPLMIRWPNGTPSGATCDQPVSTIDLYPTMLAMAGLPGDETHNETVDGVSLVSLLKSPKAELEREDLFWHYPHYYQTTTPASAIRSGDWKLLKYHEDGRVELYNLATDLSETTDLSRQLPERALELRQRLDQWLATQQAQLPMPNPNAGRR